MFTACLQRLTKMPKATQTKYWPTVAARIPPELKEKLILKHSNAGDVSFIIRQLLEKYLQGRILGIVTKKETV